MTPVTPGAPRRYEELSLSRAAKLFARGLSLRCPHCGAGGLLESWFRLRPKCPVCGLRTDRGEEDFFLGGMMWNIVFSEGMLLLAALALGIAIDSTSASREAASSAVMPTCATSGLV